MDKEEIKQYLVDKGFENVLSMKAIIPNHSGSHKTIIDLIFDYSNQSLQEKEERIRELEEENRWYTPEEKLPEEAHSPNILVEKKDSIHEVEKAWFNQGLWFTETGVGAVRIKRWRYLPTPPTDNNQNNIT